MNYPAASNGVSKGNYNCPKVHGIKPLSAEDGIKQPGKVHAQNAVCECAMVYSEKP
jgi:hypothetical protein